MLLLAAGRVVSVDRLVEALWEGKPPATAVASLQNFVAQLRKALGPDVIGCGRRAISCALAPSSSTSRA